VGQIDLANGPVLVHIISTVDIAGVSNYTEFDPRGNGRSVFVLEYFGLREGFLEFNLG
jgi:hypothetical protein